MTRARSNECRASRCRPSAARISPRLLSCVASVGMAGAQAVFEQRDRPIDVRQRLLVAPEPCQRDRRGCPRRCRRRGDRARAPSPSAPAPAAAPAAPPAARPAGRSTAPMLLSCHACSSSWPPSRCSTASAVLDQRSASVEHALLVAEDEHELGRGGRRERRRGATASAAQNASSSVFSAAFAAFERPQTLAFQQQRSPRPAAGSRARAPRPQRPASPAATSVQRPGVERAFSAASRWRRSATLRARRRILGRAHDRPQQRPRRRSDPATPARWRR